MSYSGFLNVFKYCCEHEDHHMVPMNHQKIIIDADFHAEMTKEDVIQKITYLMACDMYLNNYFYEREDKFYSIAYEANILEEQIDDYRSDMTKPKTSKEEKMKIRRSWRNAAEKLKDIYAKKKLITEDLRRGLAKVTRLYEEELLKPRQWKKILDEVWGPISDEKIEERVVFNPCMFHADPQTGEKDYHTIFMMFPQIKQHIKTLVKTSFRMEFDETCSIDTIQINPITTTTLDNTTSHALIKRSKFKYQYIIANTSSITHEINNDDVIFCEEVKQIKNDYLKNIADQMRLIVKDAKPRSISFDKNTFVFKSTDQQLLKQIVSIYKNVHV